MEVDICFIIGGLSMSDIKKASAVSPAPSVPPVPTAANEPKSVDFNYVMKICLLYGKILQESNATNDMIQNNIKKIVKHLHLESNEISTYNAETSFIIINRHDNSIKMIPVKNASYNFEKIVKVDQLLEDFLANKVNTDDFFKGLHTINEKSYPFKVRIQILSAGLVCAGMFVIINGMDWAGVLLTFVLGFVSYYVFLLLQKYFNIKMFSILAYSTFLCLMLVLLSRLKVVDEPYSILFSCIMPLLPGTTFVNSIKSIMDGNYISGIIQVMDAMNTALMLGLPVAIIFTSML